ncbi:agamous-like MADS-box protein AGL80 [Chenopodium quinoa]|uniref:agamous-like MADS-box protein AGL80 n=1 Tax=Chenopodium quinoa TaxID=63459 RepID=UPI000B778568|nr:agamous-like MADS-box protein AGL80 [Chenopodium quinoa]
MARKKLKLEYITNDSARKATFKKRKKGLLKKLTELTTLCAVEGCLLIHSPYAARTEAWPSRSDARRVLERFKDLSPEDQEKRMLDQEAYLRQRIAKAKQLLEKLRKDNKEKEITQLMYECVNGVRNLGELNLEDRKDVVLMAKKMLEEVDEEIEIKSLEVNEGIDNN